MRNKFLFILILIPQLLLAQKWTVIHEFQTRNDVSAIDYDKSSKVYIGTKQGSLIQLNKELLEMNRFSLPNTSSLTSISAWNPLRVFVFLRDNQQYYFIDRFSSRPIIYDISAEIQGYIMSMSPSQDHSFWAISSGDFSLKKFNETTRQELVNIPLSIQVNIDNPKKLESNASNIFILNEEGDLIVLDTYGNKLMEIVDQEIKDFNIYRNELFYLTAKEICSTTFYSKNKSEKKRFPLDENLKGELFEVIDLENFLIAIDNRVILLNYSDL